MIRHIVLLRPAPTTPSTRIEEILEGLNVLQSKLPGMTGFHVGTNVNSLPGLDQGFTYAFTIDFQDAATRDAYYESADHISVADQLQPLFANGLDDIIMFQISL